MLRDSGYYTGITNNLHRRISEHKAGKSISTRNRLPVMSCVYWVAPNRKIARSLEVLIKNKGARKWLSVNGHRMKVFYTNSPSNFPASHQNFPSQSPE